MEGIYKLIVFLYGAFLPLTSSRHVQFFRKDYTYIDEFDAFYKVHWDLYGLSWSSAFMACDDEGAMLFYPSTQGEWTLAKNLTQDMAEPPNVTDIFVGLHDEFGLGEFITVDGHSTASPLHVGVPESIPGLGTKCVLLNIETGLYRIDTCFSPPDSPTPFICKRVDNESCPTIDQGYKYVKSSKKCYKINRKSKMWDEAMRTCYMEGGILTVLENQEQSEALNNMLERGLTYHVGVRKMFSQGDYYTVKGQRIDDVNQRNAYSGSQYDCGAIYFDNVITTTTTDCGNRLPFICEIEVNM